MCSFYFGLLCLISVLSFLHPLVKVMFFSKVTDAEGAKSV